MKKKFNPFNTVIYTSEKYFCDRKNEIKRLASNAQNSINTTLISSRKYGKTALLYRLFEELNKKNDWYCIYIDIYSTQNIKEFAELLTKKALQIFPQKESIGKKLLKFIKSLRPVISYDSLSGQPEVHFEYTQQIEYEKTLESILRFLDNQNKPILIAFDEFQQVSFYPEKNTEALLRTIIQTLKNTQFIFSGSHQHLMMEMFNSAKRPFFSSTQSMTLEEIPKELYIDFIKTHFLEAKKEITDETIDFILDWTLNHTYYTQFICNKIFAELGKKINLANTKLCCKRILEAEESTFLQYRNLITPFQWKLLIAIAKEEKVFQPQSKDFIQKHKLGAASTVKKAIDSLSDKELIFHQNKNQESYYRIYDVFMMRWMQWKY